MTTARPSTTAILRHSHTARERYLDHLRSAHEHRRFLLAIPLVAGAAWELSYLITGAAAIAVFAATSALISLQPSGFRSLRTGVSFVLAMTLATLTAHFARPAGTHWLPVIVPALIAIGIAVSWLLGIGLNGLSMVPINAVGILCGAGVGLDVSLLRLLSVAIGAGAGVGVSRYFLHRENPVESAQAAIDAHAQGLAQLLAEMGDAVRNDTVNRGTAKEWLGRIQVMSGEEVVDDALARARDEARYGLVGREGRALLSDLDKKWGEVTISGLQVRGIARTLHDAATTGVIMSLPPVVADAVLLASTAVVSEAGSRIDPAVAAAQLRANAHGSDMLTSAAVVNSAMRIVEREKAYSGA